jgi:hypothetical protein
MFENQGKSRYITCFCGCCTVICRLSVTMRLLPDIAFHALMAGVAAMRILGNYVLITSSVSSGLLHRAGL